MNLPTSIASIRHDHSQCIDEALNTARVLCNRKGARMTELREKVLRLVWQSHQPLGAYQLMDMLASQSTRRVAPPTVYRALDFLLQQGLIHRINSLNAFIGCTRPEQGHANNFFICKCCGIAIEFSQPSLQASIEQTAALHDFTMQSQSLELVGLCAQCKAGSTDTQP